MSSLFNPLRTQPTTPPTNKQQTRARKTQTKLLEAAQELFSEQGFEKTLLEEVAVRAGYSRGAIYANFSNKDDLFLALIENLIYTKFALLYKKVEEEADADKRASIFKHWITDQVRDPVWCTLTLEFKLYALRRPESRKKLQFLNELLYKSTAEIFVELLFGKDLTKASRAAAECRLAIMGAVLSAVVLESHFRPDLLPMNQLQSLTDEVFEALVHA